ncbi:MAG: YceI family protein, partial [Pseudomonadota bacterium]
ESTKGPIAPARGGVVAFGAALAVFAGFAGAPLVANALSPGVENAEGVEGENWVIDYDNSEIRFSVIYDGKSVSGVFTDWTASIRFDNDDLESASATVVVDTGSAQTGTKLYDDSLKAAEWFNVAEFPTANVSLSNFRLAPKGYWADLSLTIKDIEIQRKLRFYLEGKNGQAWASGNTTIRRQDVDLGQTSDPKGEWVADAVRVDIAVIADPAE